MALGKSVAAQLLEMPKVLRQAAGRVAGPDAARRPGPGHFSLVEHACHLRDLEEEGYTLRIRRMLREDTPVLADFDGSAVAATRNYPGQDLEAALLAFEEARRQNVDLLQGLPEAMLERRARFGDRGLISLHQLAGLMLEHDASHRVELDSLMLTLRP